MLRFEPNESGKGYEYVDAIVGGSIPRQFIPAVDKGIVEGLQRGLIAGFPVVDVKVTVFDGKYHAVDSDEMSFRMAGINGVKAAAEKVKPVLLEPIYKARIWVPEANMGDVIGDINSKRGHVLGMDFEGDQQVVTVNVPLSEMQRYAIDLRQITGGRGQFEMEFDHYAQMPPQEAQKVVDAHKAESKDD
jgi:elongation factor G